MSGRSRGSRSPAVAVIGGGLAGLASARCLEDMGATVTVLEGSDRVGGVVRSVRADGFLAEEGPHSLGRPSERVLALLSALGLLDPAIAPDASRDRRYILHRGTPTELPTSPTAVLRSPLLSLRARAQILLEGLRPSVAETEDESVADLLRRRGLSDPTLHRLLDAFVAGVCAGNPERLSARHAFPLLQGLVDQHGSIVRGLFVRKLQARSARRNGSAHETLRAGTPPIFSFPKGMQEIPQALASGLTGEVRLGCPVRAIERNGRRWRIPDAGGEIGSFDAIVVAVPAPALTELRLPDSAGPLLRAIGKIRVPPIALLTLGFPISGVEHPLDGFGMLVPAAEGRGILGTLFPSSLFPGRAPEGHVSTATFVGGARQPDLAGQDAESIESLVRSELEDVLGVRAPPSFRHLKRWTHSIPQFETGRADVKDAIVHAERALPGLYLAGSWVGGVSVSDAIESGMDAADRAAEGLGGLEGR